MTCILDKKEPYWCEADWKCKDCPNWMEDAESEGMTREEAINMLYGIRADNLNLDDAYTKDKYDGLTMAIKALEQEPRKGHWMPYLKEGLIVKCSECKSRYTLGYNFCPNCGADMREVVEE